MHEKKNGLIRQMEIFKTPFNEGF